jgi:hypothetical protein
MPSHRPVTIAFAASFFLSLAACGGSEAIATNTGDETALDAGAGDAADASSRSLGVVATDVLEIAVTGGLPAGCPGQGYRAASTHYRVELETGALDVSRTTACLDDAGAEPAPVETTLTLDAADRDAVVALAEALVAKPGTPEDCPIDAPDERLTITHRDHTAESWPVRLAHCAGGLPLVRYAEYSALRARLDALAP